MDFINRVFILLLLCCNAMSFQLSAQQTAENKILLQEVRIFDGKNNRLSELSYVLIENNLIQQISATPLTADDSTTVIAAGGRTLMPGLIDAHFHLMMTATPLHVALNGAEGYVNLLAAREANNTLMRGFTSVRDLAGPVFSIKQAIDEGLIAGPRIWPSGAMISQTSGHGDYRQLHDLPRATSDHLHYSEQTGGAAIADGVDEVLKRVREQLMLGASQIKLAAGGGVSSNYDPLDVAQYTEAEFKAAVDAAENWGTYVTVHAYTPRAIQTAIKAGVKVIDHGQLIDEATAKLMAKNGTWLSIQPFLDDEDAIPFPTGSENRTKQLQMTQGTENAIALAKKYKLKTAWGTDSLFDAKLTARQGAQLVKMTRWYTAAEVLKMATSVNAELLALSGRRSPYKGKLGVIEQGALADLLLVDGDPLANIALLATPEQSLKLIIKDGKIYKNTL